MYNKNYYSGYYSRNNYYGNRGYTYGKFTAPVRKRRCAYISKSAGVGSLNASSYKHFIGKDLVSVNVGEFLPKDNNSSKGVTIPDRRNRFSIWAYGYIDGVKTIISFVTKANDLLFVSGKGKNYTRSEARLTSGAISRKVRVYSSEDGKKCFCPLANGCLISFGEKNGKPYFFKTYKR